MARRHRGQRASSPRSSRPRPSPRHAPRGPQARSAARRRRGRSRRRPREPVDNLCATCCWDVDKRRSAEDGGGADSPPCYGREGFSGVSRPRLKASATAAARSGNANSTSGWIGGAVPVVWISTATPFRAGQRSAAPASARRRRPAPRPAARSRAVPGAARSPTAWPRPGSPGRVAWRLTRAAASPASATSLNCDLFGLGTRGERRSSISRSMARPCG
jgi:hypothetical protein